MEECDSLLAFLRRRAQEMGRSIEEPGTLSITQLPETSVIESGVKTPKDDKTIIEELRVYNDALRYHILDLLKQTEEQAGVVNQLREENTQLKLKLNSTDSKSGTALAESSDSEKSEKYYPNPANINIDDLPSLELPPLEVPTFDFNVIGKLQNLNDSQ